MKKIIVALVEGPNDTAFIEELLTNEMPRLQLEIVKPWNLRGYIRVALLCEGDQAIVSEYASEGGFEKALKIASSLYLNLLLDRSVAGRAKYTILVMADENRKGRQRIELAKRVISNDAEKHGIELEESERRWVSKYVEASSSLELIIALVECSLECQVVKHVLGNYTAFCNNDACHNILNGMRTDERLEKFKELARILRNEGDEWYRNLRWALDLGP